MICGMFMLQLQSRVEIAYILSAVSWGIGDPKPLKGTHTLQSILFGKLQIGQPPSWPN
jgi:hypothetical protein